MELKFANPHSLSQEVERTTRAKIAERSGSASHIQNEESFALKRDLDALLQDTWADAVAKASKAKTSRNIPDNHETENEKLTFRLVSSMTRPQHISLEPKLPPRPISRAPDCEDDEVQAETRRIRSLSAAVACPSLGTYSVSTGHIKPVIVGAKVPLADIPVAGSLPALLVTEEDRAVRRVKDRTGDAYVASPHEPRPSCTVLGVTSVSNLRELSSKKHRKSVRKRPPPAYWRSPPELPGKCMGYALGYPSSWAPERPYARDAMKKGVESTETDHAVPS